MEQDGAFSILSSCPEQLEFYFAEKLYQKEPYLRHPRFFRRGCALIPATLDPRCQEISAKRFQCDHVLLKLTKQEESVEGYLFGRRGMNKEQGSDFFPHLEMMNNFISYFKEEGASLLKALNNDSFDLKRAKGSDFFVENYPVALANQDLCSYSFFPLSPRERECLELLKQGKTAKETAALLGLSRRTIEYYFDNIKDKLNCSSKRALLYRISYGD